MALTDSSTLGGRIYREVGKDSITHSGKSDSAASHSRWLRSRAVRSTLSPRSSRARIWVELTVTPSSRTAGIIWKTFLMASL